MKKKLFRDNSGDVMNVLDYAEGVTFKNNPLDFYIILARYKFASRLINKSHTVIDAGCGHGMGSIFLSAFARNVVGGDYDVDLINNNTIAHKSIANLKFEKLDLLDTGMVNAERFDVLVSLDVIEHFNEKEAEQVIENYAKLIKEGGFAVIGTPNINSQKYASQRRKDTHPKEYNYDEFKEKLEKSFSNVFVFSMNDEFVGTQFNQMAWYFMAICVK